MNPVTTVESNESAIQFTIRLDDIRQLFQVPEFDPFVPQARLTSGMDDISAYLATQRLRFIPRLKATLVLPADQITPGLLDETRAAIGRYCAFSLAQTRSHMATSRFEGRSKLPIGLTVAASTFLAVIILYLVLPETASSLLALMTPLVTVIIWVSIWNPMEVLIYDRWADRRELQVATAIQEMEISIQPA